MNACCPTDRVAVVADYTPKGTFLPNKDYVTGPEDAEFGILSIYDIFGMTSQALQMADLFAFTGGYRVYVPDFFRGNGWPLDKTDFSTVMDFVKENANWEEKILPGIVEGVAYLKNSGVKSVASIGYCWGAKEAVRALVEKHVIATAAPHPSFLNDGEECANGLPGPICFLLSQDEGPHTAWTEAVQNADPAIRDICHISRFDTMHHGWMGARGDFSNPENKQKAEEGAKIVLEFFSKVFKTVG